MIKVNSTRIVALYALGLSSFFLPASITLCEAFYYLALFITLFSPDWQQKWHIVKTNRVAWGFYALILLFLVGALYSAGDWSHIIHDWRKHIWLLTAPLLFWVVADSEEQLFVFRFFLAAMLLVLIFSYLKIFGVITDTVWPLNSMRIDPTEIASVTHSRIAQSFFLVLASSAWLSRALRIKDKRVWFWILFLIAALNLVVFNTSRTGLVLFFITTIFVLFRLLPRKNFIMALLVTVIAVSGLLALRPSFVHKTVSADKFEHWRVSHHSGKSDTIQIRLQMYRTAWQLIKKRPWFGYGTGSIAAAYKTLPASQLNLIGNIEQSIENSYLNIMLEFGAIGLVLLLGFAWLCWYGTVKLPMPWRLTQQVFLIMFFVGAFATAFLFSGFSQNAFSLMAILSYGPLWRMKER